MSKLYWPVNPNTINYGFGYPAGYGGFHNGIDFQLAQGSELRATATGTIRNVNAGTVDGWGVDIITPDGWKVRMWHTSEFLVPNGSHVEAGQIVALSGGAKGTQGAGNSTGAHLHWGVALDGRDGWVDPASLNPQSFDTPTPTPINELEDNKMITLVQTSDNGWAYIWNMATDAVQGVTSEQEFIALQQIFPVFKTANLGEFNISRDKYRDVFKVC